MFGYAVARIRVALRLSAYKFLFFSLSDKRPGWSQGIRKLPSIDSQGNHLQIRRAAR